MHQALTRLFRSTSVTLFLLGAAGAQDTRLPAVGTPTGTAFDEVAPAGQQLANVDFRHGGSIDAVRLGYRDRWHAPTGSSAWHGGPSGLPGSFAVAAHDAMASAEIWVNNGIVVGVRLSSRNGQQQAFGQAVGSLASFAAAPQDEIIGLHGTHSSGLVFSLGVTTRPRLATGSAFGTACGAHATRFRPGFEFLRLGGMGIVEVTNLPSGQPIGIIVAGFSTSMAGTIPLPLSLTPFGATGCTLYVATDLIAFAGVEPDRSAGISVQVPATTTFAGMQVSFQGFVTGANNPAGLAGANAMTCTIGAL